MWQGISINDVKAKVQPPHIMQRHSFFTRNITRKISLLITWLVVNIFPKANADIITFAWGILLLGVIYLFSKGDPQNTLYGALLLELWYILDCVDGEVARFNNKDSLRGIFLDLFLHTSIQPLLFLSLAIGTYKTYHNNLYFLAGVFLTIYYIVFTVVRGGLCREAAFIRIDKTPPSKIQKDIEKIKKEGKIIKEYNPESLQRLDFVKGKIKNILYFLLNLTDIVALMNIIFIISIVNFVKPSFYINHYKLNAIVLFIIVFAIYFVLSTFLMGAFYYIQNTPQRTYEEILGKFYTITNTQNPNNPPLP